MSALGFKGSEFFAGDGDFKTYRTMMCHPTLALAHASASAPIRSAGWSVDHDDDAPEDAVRLVQDVFDPQRSHLLAQACRSMYFGFQAFEMVWAKDGRHTVIDEFKPLLPELTKIVVSETGKMVGVKNREQQLAGEYSLVISHDVEADNWYGRSRLENLRRWAYGPWCASLEKLDAYQSKTAGVVTVVRYPDGDGYDAAGARLPNSKLAEVVLQNLSRAKGITVPNRLAAWGEDALRAGASIEELLAWQISFLETRAGHGAEFLSALSYYDKLLARGYLVTERSIMEGEFGTKAEAGVHSNVVASVSQSTLDDIVRQINKQSVDEVVRTNFGDAVVGKVYLRGAPIVDEARELFKGILTSMYAGAPDLLRTDLDVDAMADRVGLPKDKERIDAGEDESGSPRDEDGSPVDVNPGEPPSASPQPADPAGAPDGAPVQATAMTGIQITALRDLALAVTNKEIGVETAKAIAYIAFPSTQKETIDGVFDTAAAFEPKQASEPDQAIPPKLAASLRAMLASGKALPRPSVGTRKPGRRA